MKFTKRHRHQDFKSKMARRNATWKKYKDQQNYLSADRRGLKR